jgi:hypothetical protein
VFRSRDIEVIRTPFRASQANGVAERFVRTFSSKCLDWLLIFDQQHLERVLPFSRTITTVIGPTERCSSILLNEDAR